jgi:hypothetical protein
MSALFPTLFCQEKMIVQKIKRLTMFPLPFFVEKRAGHLVFVGASETLYLSVGSLFAAV